MGSEKACWRFLEAFLLYRNQLQLRQPFRERKTQVLSLTSWIAQPHLLSLNGASTQAWRCLGAADKVSRTAHGVGWQPLKTTRGSPNSALWHWLVARMHLNIGKQHDGQSSRASEIFFLNIDHVMSISVLLGNGVVLSALTARGRQAEQLNPKPPGRKPRPENRCTNLFHAYKPLEGTTPGHACVKALFGFSGRLGSHRQFTARFLSFLLNVSNSEACLEIQRARTSSSIVRDSCPDDLIKTWGPSKKYVLLLAFHGWNPEMSAAFAFWDSLGHQTCLGGCYTQVIERRCFVQHNENSRTNLVF